MPVLVTVLTAGISSTVLTGRIRRLLLRYGILDHPTERGLHERPVVRGAGLGFAIPWLIVSAVIAWTDRGRTPGIPALVLMVAALTLIGLWDDLRHIGPQLKLVSLLLVCGLAVLGGLRATSLPAGPLGTIPLGFLAFPISVLWLITWVNVFNFMDGIDGLAAAQTITAAAIAAIALAMTNRLAAALVAAALAAALAGFIPYNWNPARCFMGDAGSYFCGGALAGLLLTGDAGGLPLITTTLATSGFLVDALGTLGWRLVRGHTLWHPHRCHGYQRLVLRGWSHAQVAAAYVGVGAALGLGGTVYLAAFYR